MLEFEHIVQVNDLNNNQLTPITRTQLWHGLVLRARSPDKFIQGMQCCTRELGDQEFVRIIEAGGSSFCEKVVLYPQDRIHTSTLEKLDQIQAESTTRIEEPETGYLFVRFSYRRELELNTDAVDVAEHLKAAYVQVDRDAIAMIRMLAESKLFDHPVN